MTKSELYDFWLYALRVSQTHNARPDEIMEFSWRTMMWRVLR